MLGCGGNMGGDDDDDVAVDARTPTFGNANIVHGPSSGAGAATLHGGVPAEGRWIISPDQGRARVLNLTFNTADPSVFHVSDLTDCVFTYDRGDEALTNIFSCPFEMPPPGEYTSLGLMVSKDFELLVDDPLHGIYSDPAAASLFATTPPAGGADFVPFSVAFDPSFSFYMSTPLVIEADSTLDLSIVTDMTHTTFVNVAGGVPSFRTDFIPVPMNLQVTPGQVAKAAFYTESGTAENFFMGTNYGTSGEPLFVRLFYATATDPAYLFSSGQANGQDMCGTQAYNIDPAGSPVFPDGGVAGGFLGLDSAGDLCWAVREAPDYSSYHGVVSMPEVANVGGQTVFSCDLTTTAPAPTSGGNYSSGCPTVTADVQGTVTLVAQ
jgi:hypothetical protein